MAEGIITLCTDFGIRDGYVGAVKGVILSLAPEARIVDISHEITRQAIREAAWVLYTTYRYFAPGTVHLVVVDPGVGSARRMLALRTASHYFVAPDNGVLGYVLAEDAPLEVVSLTRPAYWRANGREAISHTFHGRDIMAPVAAHLVRGVALSELGDAVDDWVRLAFPRPQQEAKGAIVGRVVAVDHYGNLITNIPEAMLPVRRDWVITVGSLQIVGLSTAYASVVQGEPLALIGGHGYLEIAVREGSAAQHADAQVDTEVLLS